MLIKEVIWDQKCFYQNITHIADNLVISTLKYNSQSLSGSIPEQLHAAACNSVHYAFVIFCYADFAHLGFLTQKVLFRRGEQNGFKALLLNVDYRFGWERGISTVWAQFP